MKDSPDLPKSYVLTYFLTFLVGLGIEIACLVQAYFTEHDFLTDAVLGPLIFLGINVVLFGFYLIVFCFHRPFFVSAQRWLSSSHTWYKDLLNFLLNQGLAFSILYWVEVRLFQGGKSTFDPASAAMLSFALEINLLSLYPYLWALSEPDNLDLVLATPNDGGMRKAFRILSLVFTLAFSALSYVSFFQSSAETFLNRMPALLIAIFFTLLFVAEIILLKKKLFDRVFSFFVINENPWKIFVQCLLVAPMGLAIFYLIKNISNGSNIWVGIWSPSTMLILGFLFVVFPIIFVRGPATKELAGPKNNKQAK